MVRTFSYFSGFIACWYDCKLEELARDLAKGEKDSIPGIETFYSEGERNTLNLRTIVSEEWKGHLQGIANRQNFGCSLLFGKTRDRYKVVCVFV
ncbi:hypothetical protein Y032_0031g2246 [Ancylostoma ceylanicum]|nr:hypothetical protein Y032_0031g2246 [Ancylostoma ceylanicum]